MDHFGANMVPLKSVTLGAMGSLLRKLDELARTEDAARQLQDDLDIISTNLSNLSMAEDPSITANYWMKDVRELSYDMEDCVDQFFLANDSDTKMAWISNLLGFRSRLDEVRERYDRYNLEYGLSHPTTTVKHRFRTMYRELHVGMEAPINQLRWLIDPKSNDENDLQLKVISILGVEGVGKSTLARNIWRELERQFEYKAFVQTAKMPDMKIILHSILSQICLQQTAEACSVPNLIHDIRKHLQDKRYFIIIDDLWAVSVWDTLSRSFPEGNHCSRVITTTTIEDVALASCSYEPEHIFQLEPLDADHSYQLFISRVFGSQYGCPQQVNDISAYIARNCGGLPLAIICIATLVASQRETIEHWEFVQRFLRHNLRTSSTFAEILKQVLKLCFSSLPDCLKTCLLYLSAYPENYVFLKDDLVKQWIAEDFICTMEGMDLVEVASSYFDEFLDLGLIQRIDTNSKKKGLSYVVHPTVFDFIAGKSSEDNFITVIDYFQPTVALTEKIHRLALHFGSATYATTAANIGQSQVRSIIFTGFLSCMPSLSEFKLVRVMILHLHADVGDTRFSLVEICKLLLLRYLQVSCSITVILPAKVQCLRHLEILEINAVVSAVPSDILNHPSLLHVRLGRKAKHKHFTVGAVTSGDAVVLNDSGRTSYAPIQKFELLPPICSFSRVPLWIEQCRGLRSLEVLVRELWTYDLDLLGQLPALKDLSLYVREHTAWSSVTFRSGAFQVLRYLKLVCGVLPMISFLEEAVPNLRRLKIGFNAHSREEYGNLLSGIHHLPNLEKITASIGIATGADESDRIAAETMLTAAMDKHPCHPSFSVNRVGPVDKEYGSSGKKNKSQETWSSNERDKGMKKDIEILHECSSNEQPGILEINGEKMIATLLAAGASATAVTDPTAQHPVGKTAAFLASERGHMGLAGYLSEVRLTSHLASLTIEESDISKGSAVVEAERAVESISQRSAERHGGTEDELSMKDSLAAVRNAAQAAARIQNAFRAFSFRKRQQKTARLRDEYGMTQEDIDELAAAAASRSYHQTHASSGQFYEKAAISIQKKYKGWKGRKNFLNIRKNAVKIQAHVRGHQARKRYKTFVSSVSVLQKVILRWLRRRGVIGRKYFRKKKKETSPASHSG